jgi:hypothetical protein
MDTKKYKGCIVVQGPTNPNVLPKIKECWTGYQLIFSTWEGSHPELYDSDDIVVWNKFTDFSGTSNLNRQKITTWNGMALAEKMGWDWALKWRSDMWCYGADLIWHAMDKDSFNILSWNTESGGYIQDYIMGGKPSEVISLFDTELEGPFAEFMLTRKLYESDLHKKTKCFGRVLNDRFCDIGWWKKNIGGHDLWLSTYNGHPHFKFEIPDEKIYVAI